VPELPVMARKASEDDAASAGRYDAAAQLLIFD
jgi:hypothetical protein